MWVFMKPPRLLQTPVRIAAKDVSVALGKGDSLGDTVPLRDRDLLVLVGFTGAGKSTTLAALEDRGILSAILPDRRELTDKVILPAMTGDPARKITDRLERFSLTAAFRDRHPGGMGEVLEHIGVPRTVPDGLIVFDGLRGKTEIIAASRMPKAVFLYLETSPDIRLTRLCLRDDPFDRASVEGSPSPAPQDDGERERVLDILDQFGISRMIDAPTRQNLATRLVENGVEPDMVAQAAAIVSDEATHYSAAETLDALHRLAPDRTLILDSGLLSPNAVADGVIAGLNA